MLPPNNSLDRLSLISLIYAPRVKITMRKVKTTFKARLEQRNSAASVYWPCMCALQYAVKPGFQASAPRGHPIDQQHLAAVMHTFVKKPLEIALALADVKANAALT
jgi:hypothetical protein